MGGWFMILQMMGGGGTDASAMIGQWANVLTLNSRQPRLDLESVQSRIILKSNQSQVTQ